MNGDSHNFQVDLREVLTDIVEGRIVKRAKHDLVLESKNLVVDFIGILKESGYMPRSVRDVDVQPGERVPAFYIDENTAYFGWVFWEKFSHLKLRKLFGSVVRDTKGDWAVQIPPTRNTVVYANLSLRAEMDIENPSGF
jgi:hypothetical protein